MVQQHPASFIAHTEASTGSGLLRFIKDEFDALLECEILAYDSLRPHCGGCGHDKLLAFSCKRWVLPFVRSAAGTFAVMRRATTLGVAAAPRPSYDAALPNHRREPMSGDEDLFRKDVKLELSKFRAKTKPTLAEAIALRIERVEAEKRKEADRLKKIDLRLATLTADCAKVAAASCAVIKQNLKKYEFDKKDPRGLVKWYADTVDKESGVDVPRSDLKLMGNLSLEKGEASLFLKGKL